MDSRDLINVDDLVRQRLGGGEERELPGAWPRMLDLLEKEDKKRPFAFFYWGRGIYFGGALLLLALLTAGGLHFSPVLDGFRGLAGITSKTGGHSAQHKSVTDGAIASSATSHHSVSGHPNSRGSDNGPGTNAGTSVEQPTNNSDYTESNHNYDGSAQKGNDIKNAIVHSKQTNQTAVNTYASGTLRPNHVASNQRSGTSYANGTDYTVKGAKRRNANTNHTVTPIVAANTVTNTAATNTENSGSRSDVIAANSKDVTTDGQVSLMNCNGENATIKASRNKSTANGRSVSTRQVSAVGPKGTLRKGTVAIPAGEAIGKRISNKQSPFVGINKSSARPSADINSQPTEADSYDNTHPLLSGIPDVAKSNATVPSGVNKAQNGTVTDYSITAKRSNKLKTITPVPSGKNSIKTVVPAANISETPSEGQSSTTVVSAVKPNKFKTHSKYQLQTKSKLDRNGTVVFHQDTIDVSVDSFKLADNEPVGEHDDDLITSAGQKTNPSNIAVVNKPLNKLSSSTTALKHKPAKTIASNSSVGRNGTTTVNRRTKGSKLPSSTNSNDNGESGNRSLFLAVLRPVRPSIILPQASLGTVKMLDFAAKTEAKKKKSSHAWEDISNAFNDIKYNFSNAEFSKGITAGLNATFFGPNSFRGFQFGFVGSFLFNEKWSCTGEIKYFHRMNSNYAIKDYFAPNATDSVVNSFSFSTLHSFEMPWALKYTYKNWSFIGGPNFLYTLGVNTGAAALPYQRVNSTAPVGQAAPMIDEKDFKGRFGLGYLLGFSVKVSPNVCLDVRNVQTFWDNAGSTGAKNVSSQLYKSPSLQFSIQYMFGRRSED